MLTALATNAAPADTIHAGRALILILQQQPHVAINHCHQYNCWQRFSQLASKHLLAAYIAENLLPHAKTLPVPVHDFLEAVEHLNNERNQTLLKTALAVISKLNQVDINPVALKGTGLLLNCAKRKQALVSRMQSDIDLLIPATQLDTASQQLLAEGYQFGKLIKHDDGTPALVAAKPHELTALQRQYRQHHHLPPLIHPNHNTTIELHRHLSSPRFAKQLNTHTLTARAETIQFDKVRYRLLNHVDQFKHWLYHEYIGTGVHARRQIPFRLLLDWQLLGTPELPNDKVYQRFVQLQQQLEQLATQNDYDMAVSQLLTHPSKQQRYLRQHLATLNGSRSQQFCNTARFRANQLQNIYYTPSWYIQKLREYLFV